jgi:hypothetical protein
MPSPMLYTVSFTMVPNPALRLQLPPSLLFSAHAISAYAPAAPLHRNPHGSHGVVGANLFRYAHRASASRMCPLMLPGLSRL